MPDETYYKVTLQVELTIRSDSPEWAIDAALAAISDAAGGAVHAVTTDRGETSAEKIDFDPDEMARMEQWLQSRIEQSLQPMKDDPRHFDHEV
jgi:hypothetical protein